MKRKLLQQTALAAGVAASALCGADTQAQSVDALLHKLVEKNVITAKEAEQLKQESDQGFAKAYQAKTSMPDWVTSLKFSGDFRGRFEKHNADNAANIDRNRYRYRLRYGAYATIKDDFEVGFRLTSANPVNSANGTTTFGGNPVSNNTDLSDGASKKFVFIDAAYARWSPIHHGPWTASATIGKMDNSFALSPMVFDADYQPEGAAIQAGYSFNDQHTLKFNGAYWVLDEFNQASASNPSASHDPYMMGAQLLWDGKWSKKLETALGVSVFNISGKENLNVPAAGPIAPNINDGNTRNAAGQLLNNYNPVVANASVTYKLDDAPFYHGAFPIRLAGEFMHNPAAATRRQGFWGGVTLGKAGRKGLWDVAYKWQRLEADAWYEEFPDDDNGAFYAAGLPGSGFGAGYRGGTNVKGHVMKGNYSLTDSLTFTVTYYLTDLINPNPAGSKSDAGHLLVDLMWKF